MCPNVSKRIGQAAFVISFIGVLPAWAQNGRPSVEPGSGSDADLCAAQQDIDYTLGPHIGAIFAVLISSFLGITLPLFTRGHKGKIWTEAFFLSRFLGAGVIVATAFVHLLYESFVQLESPCIHLAYEPTAPAIAMASALMIMLVDFAVQRALRGPRSSDYQTHVDASDGCIAQNKVTYTFDKVDKADLDLDNEERRLAWEKDQKQKYMDLLVVEGGIIFHSVMVGLGLGIAEDGGLAGYMVAICFHQFCDGLAIGTRLALIDLSHAPYKRVALVLAYTFVTPTGIAIGVGVRQFYNGNDASTILAIGVLDSISAGVLLYGALVDIIAKDVLFGSLVHASNRRVLSAFAALFLGAAIMSFIGQYA